MKHKPIIVALDFPRPDLAFALVDRLHPDQCRLKVGFELFLAGGPMVVERLQRAGFDVFLDLKFHDIPNTVAAACKMAASLGVWMLNVHAGGGSRMISAAREALESRSTRPLLIAVTVLTSMAGPDLDEVGVAVAPGEQVARLAALALAAGADGVVCSAQEAPVLRQRLGSQMVLVTPGIRLGDERGTDDQRRVVTPQTAIANGSDYLVIGRPITGAADPVAVLNGINLTLDA